METHEWAHLDAVDEDGEAGDEAEGQEQVQPNPLAGLEVHRQRRQRQPEADERAAGHVGHSR